MPGYPSADRRILLSGLLRIWAEAPALNWYFRPCAHILFVGKITLPPLESEFANTPLEVLSSPG